jgi:two-component system, LuxR family, sensor kinase FixL
MTSALRASGAAVVVVGLGVAWVVAETVRRAQETNALVVHTQQVLALSETMAAKLVDADRNVRTSGHSATPTPQVQLDSIRSAAEVDLDQLAALTADNLSQQDRIKELRQQTRRAFDTLGTVAAASRAGEAASIEQVAAREDALDTARNTVRSVRSEENRLLADRLNDNQRAVRRLQWLAIGLGAVSSLFGSLVYWLMVRRAARVRAAADALARANDTLEERVKAHAAELRRANARLVSIIDSAVEAIIVIDAVGCVEEFNPAAERLFGYQASEVIGRKVNVLMPEPYQAEHDGYLARHLTTGEQRIIGQGREVQGRRRDGSTFPLHLSVGKMMVDGEKKFTGILHDLSDRVRIEEQLREQTALARIGEMAAVLAHEVKNPLAGIRGAIQVIGTRLPDGSRDGAIIGEIIARIDALNGLMQDLLLFARPPQPRPTVLDLGRLIQATAELFGSDPNQEIRVNIAGSAPSIEADGELLKIVFVNLLANAGQAMQGRGTIDIAISHENGRCQVSVADQGPGIPPELRDKIFVPFFTTKSRGSGLGLPTAKRFVDVHRGNIHITCPAAGGTVVTVDLPHV